MSETVLLKMWTRNLSKMPDFSHQNLEKYLLSANSSIDHLPKGASRHKKLGYQLFKSGYVSGVLVKPDVRKGNDLQFLVRGKVNAQMKKSDYTVYVHFDSSGEICHGHCECPAGKGGCCKHVAALLFQLLDYKELELNEVPVELSCTEKLQSWNVPKTDKKGAVLFEDLLFEQADYRRDSAGRKRPFVKGKREDYKSAPSFAEKVTERDIKRLRGNLDSDQMALRNVLDDNGCKPFDYEEYLNNIPSKIKLEKKKKVLLQLNKERVRVDILNQLKEFKPEPLISLTQKQHEFVQDCLKVTVDESYEIERNTRGQADCPEWFFHRRKRLTASNFGSVMNRRESIFPKAIVENIKTSNVNTRAPISCKWGKENEENALLKYYETRYNQVDLCQYVGFVVNPKWPWLGASPDALAVCHEDPSNYGAVEIKCPSSKVNMSIAEACQDKTFYLSKDINGQVSLKKKHQYYHQLQGIMAICQLNWIDFVVYTVVDMHVERVDFDLHNWKDNMLPKLTNFFFVFLM